jgi:hypothetical protein
MRRHRFCNRWTLAAITIAGLALLGCGPADTADAEDGFRPLEMSDFEGPEKWFRVEDGAIVGGTTERRIPHNAFLASTDQFGDFELRLEVKTVGPANGGIQFHSQRVPNSHEMIGYQADVGRGWWGKLYDESRRRRVLAAPPANEQGKSVKRGEWNDYRLRAEDGRIQVWINGQQTIDYTEPDKEIPRKGRLGLQIHSGPASEVWYRHLRIKRLGEQ